MKTLLFIATLLFAGTTHAATNFNEDLPFPVRPAPQVVSHSVVLNWTQGIVPANAICSGGGSPSVTGNKIYRGATPGGEGPSAQYSILTPATTFTDTAVVAGTTYYYQVTAVNCNGESQRSTEISATIPNPVAPNAPTGVTATAQ